MAVEEDLDKRVAGVGGLVEDGAVEGDEMLVGGKFEAADAVGGFGEAFVFGEGVHFEDALGAVGVLLLPPAVGGEGFGAELGLGETGEFEGDRDGFLRFEADLFGEGETPALAVVFGGFPRGGDLIEDRAVLGPRCAFGAAFGAGFTPFGEGFDGG